MYLLTKKQLSESIYYCGAGIDLQPLLRFGDFITDYVYVSTDLRKNDLINGINRYVERLNSNGDSILLVNDIQEINLSDIEHKVQDQLIAKPQYLNNEQFRNYTESFNQIRIKSEHFYLLIKFKLKIGVFEKELRVFYIIGEALATYEALYAQQNILAKIFISIQTGLIERPALFSDNMFRSYKCKPKVWIRGVWTNDEFGISSKYPEVFNTYGIYNKQIGEFMNWDSHLGIQIEGVTDRSNKYRIVKAYGEKNVWEIENKEIILESKGLTVRKIFAEMNITTNSKYTIGKYNIELPRATKTNNFLNDIYCEYLYLDKKYPNIQIYEKAIIPYGYESGNLYISDFVKKFKQINNKQLVIDIYYKNELDFNRDF
jgi:hypothetical protein